MDIAEADTFEQSIARGLACRGQQDFAGAIGHLREAGALRPGSVGAACELAFTYLQAGAFDEAWTGYRSVCEADPDNVDALAGLGRICRRRGDVAAALGYFRAAIQRDPRRAGIGCELARLLRATEQLAEAQQVLAQVLAADPVHPAALTELGLLARRRGDSAEAESRYRAALAADAACWPALVGLGLLARDRGEHAQSLDCFEKAAEREPVHAGIRCEMAFSLRLLDRLDEAEALYRAAIEADPCAPAPLHGLSAIASARGQFDAALRFAQRACAIDPADIDGRLTLCALYRELGQPAEAAAVIDRVLTTVPDHAGAWLEQGRLLRARDDRAGALAAFQRATTLDRPRGLAEMAAELLALGLADEARDTYQALLATHPDDLSAMIGLAEIALLAGDNDACVAACDAVLVKHPRQVASIRLKCRALLQMGSGDEALRVAGAVCAQLPDSVEAAAIRLDVLRTCGRRAQALEALREPPFAEARGFVPWIESLLTRLAVFDLAGAAAMLRDPPVLRPAQRAHALCAEGALAALLWRVGDAIRAYEHALAIRPADAGVHQHLARLHLLHADAERASHHLRAGMPPLRGRPKNVSQTLGGQLLNELRLEPSQSAYLASLAREEPLRQIEALRGVVGARPALTPPALCLLRALRQAGAFAASEKPPADEIAKIPRRITQYRHETCPAEDVARLLRGWMEMHPGYQYRRFDRATAIEYLASYQDAAYVRAFLRAHDPSQASDLLRLVCLFHEGGFWIDAGQRCVGDLSAVADPGAVLIVHQQDHAEIGTGLIGCAPGDAVVERALALAVQSLLRGDADNCWLATGAGMFTRAFAGVLVAQGDRWRQWLGERCVLDRAEFAAVCWPEPAWRRQVAH